MTMSQETIKDALIDTEPVDTEAAAIVALVDAYGIFASEATAGVLPLLEEGVSLGKSAMSATLVGMNEDGAGLVKIPQGIVAFWAAVALGLSTSFTGATAITPPPHAALAVDFATVALSNVTSAATEEEAMNSIANIVYNNAIIGGTVTVGVSTFPIL